MSDEGPQFNSGVIKPMECLKEGWHLIRDRYWLFFGIVVIGIIIASLGPMGVIVGPCMCGIYYCFLRREAGEPVKFEMLFRGFDYFVQSLIATLIMLVPVLLVAVPAYILLMVLFFANLPTKPNTPPNFLPIILGVLVFSLLLTAVQVVVQVLCFFTYPLIVERKMKGIDALKLSLKAAKANLGGLIGLVLLDYLLSFVGVLACYVGAFFVMPIHFAANFVAYRKVFERLQPPEPENTSLGVDLEPLPE